MAAPRSLIVKFNNDRNCFITVPKNTFSSKDFTIFQCEWDDDNPQRVFATPNPNRFSQSGTIEFPRAFAECLNLKENADMQIYAVSTGPRRRQKHHDPILFSPCSVDDYEFVEQNQMLISGQILQQITVISSNISYPIWMNRTKISIKCSENLPNDYLLLQEGDEIIIETKIRKKNQQKEQQSGDCPNAFYTFRLQAPLDDENAPQIGEIFLNEETLERHNLECGDILVLHCFVPSLIVKEGQVRKDKNKRSRIFLIGGSSEYVSADHIRMNPIDRNSIGIPLFTPIIGNIILPDQSIPQKIFLKKIHFVNPDALYIPSLPPTNEIEEQNIKKEFVEWYQDSSHIALNSVIELNSQYFFCSLDRPFDSKITNFYFIQFDSTREIDLIIEENKEIIRRQNDWPSLVRYRSYNGFSEEFEQLLQFVQCHISSSFFKIQRKTGCSHLQFGHVVVCGPKGGGKTHCVKHLAYTLQKDFNCSVIHINCIDFVDAKTSDALALLTELFSEALQTQPTAIIFDDIDKWIFNPNDRQTLSNIRCSQLAERLGDIVTSISRAKRHEIALIATAMNWESVHDDLKLSDLFNHRINLPSPSAEHRITILRTLIREPQYDVQLSHKSVLNNITNLIEGYSCYDLTVLLETVVRVGRSHNKNILTTEDFEQVTNEYKPASLKTVQLKESSANWEDIGGLEQARALLKETFEFPTQYKKLFDTAPIRMRSGLLLYGPPGCGKTMLASAVAKECGLNLISVKGPELLNKYIGASEQSVREVFERAAIAAPCILFFDEFDAIAPRRGGDSTGVTDRVVNQLLSFLDGVETREGVYFLAASSRPDLIDVALLRPGRLDKSVFCDFPNQNERFDILKKLTSKYEQISSEMLKSVAEKTENFTGADLQSIITTAQVLFARERMRNRTEEKFTFHEGYLNSSLETTGPSIAPTRRKIYTQIYEEFSGKIISKPSRIQKVIQE